METHVERTGAGTGHVVPQPETAVDESICCHDGRRTEESRLVAWLPWAEVNIVSSVGTEGVVQPWTRASAGHSIAAEGPVQLVRLTKAPAAQTFLKVAASFGWAPTFPASDVVNGNIAQVTTHRRLEDERVLLWGLDGALNLSPRVAMRPVGGPENLPGGGRQHAESEVADGGAEHVVPEAEAVARAVSGWQPRSLQCGHVAPALARGLDVGEHSTPAGQGVIKLRTGAPARRGVVAQQPIKPIILDLGPDAKSVFKRTADVRWVLLRVAIAETDVVDGNVVGVVGQSTQTRLHAEFQPWSCRDECHVPAQVNVARSPHDGGGGVARREEQPPVRAVAHNAHLQRPHLWPAQEVEEGHDAAAGERGQHGASEPGHLTEHPPCALHVGVVSASGADGVVHRRAHRSHDSPVAERPVVAAHAHVPVAAQAVLKVAGPAHGLVRPVVAVLGEVAVADQVYARPVCALELAGAARVGGGAGGGGDVARCGQSGAGVATPWGQHEVIDGQVAPVAAANHALDDHLERLAGDQLLGELNPHLAQVARATQQLRHVPVSGCSQVDVQRSHAGSEHVVVHVYVAAVAGGGGLNDRTQQSRLLTGTSRGGGFRVHVMPRRQAAGVVAGRSRVGGGCQTRLACPVEVVRSVLPPVARGALEVTQVSGGAVGLVVAGARPAVLVQVAHLVLRDAEPSGAAEGVGGAAGLCGRVAAVQQRHVIHHDAAVGKEALALKEKSEVAVKSAHVGHGVNPAAAVLRGAAGPNGRHPTGSSFDGNLHGTTPTPQDVVVEGDHAARSRLAQHGALQGGQRVGAALTGVHVQQEARGSVVGVVGGQLHAAVGGGVAGADEAEGPRADVSVVARVLLEGAVPAPSFVAAVSAVVHKVAHLVAGDRPLPVPAPEGGCRAVGRAPATLVQDVVNGDIAEVGVPNHALKDDRVLTDAGADVDKGLLPQVALLPRHFPHGVHQAVVLGRLLVHRQCPHAGAVHVVPEGQAHGGASRQDLRVEASFLPSLARRWCFDVHVVACDTHNTLDDNGGECRYAQCFGIMRIQHAVKPWKRGRHETEDTNWTVCQVWSTLQDVDSM